jgi:hypothetical protein
LESHKKSKSLKAPFDSMILALSFRVHSERAAMSSFLHSRSSISEAHAPAEGARHLNEGVERVYYSGYWVKTYPVPADELRAKSELIQALTRRLFNHTEHGLNVPGARLKEARAAYVSESDPARRRVKGAMLAGALVNRATDIFRRLVELQSDGVDVRADYPLVSECGQCLIEALDLGRLVYHRSGEEGIDELWGEPFRVFSVPLADFYESRYVKTAQAMRDIDRIASAMVDNFTQIPVFSGIGQVVEGFAQAARIKTETLRSDPEIFDIWAQFVTAGERLADIAPAILATDSERPANRSAHGMTEGLQLIRNGRALVFYIARARTPMPKSTQDYIERCEFYRQHGRLPAMPAPLPA